MVINGKINTNLVGPRFKFGKGHVSPRFERKKCVEIFGC